jgi:hypothetical protein
MRPERIDLAMYRLLQSRAKRYALSALILPALIGLVPNLMPHSWLMAWRIGILIGLFGLGFVVRYAVAVVMIFLWLPDQENDTTLVLGRDQITISSPGRTVSLSPKELTFVRLSKGIAGFLNGKAAFMLPFRVISPEQRSAIEAMYIAKPASR